MTTMETILQCEKCNRYFNGDLSLRSGKSSLCVPEIFRCQEPDCDDVAARNENQEKVRRDARRNRIRGVKTGNHFYHRGAEAQRRENVRSSCPPESERTYEPVTFASPEAAASFARAPESEKEAMLDYATETQRLHDFLMPRFGQWFRNVDLIAQFGFKNFNNVMSKLRARYAEAGEPLDVDTEPVTATVWRVRLCKVEDSQRLQRENPSRRHNADLSGSR